MFGVFCPPLKSPLSIYLTKHLCMYNIFGVFVCPPPPLVFLLSGFPFVIFRVFSLSIIINTSHQKLPFGSGDDPDKLFFHQALCSKFLTHQTGNYPVTCFVSKPSRITFGRIVFSLSNVQQLQYLLGYACRIQYIYIRWKGIAFSIVVYIFPFQH